MTNLKIALASACALGMTVLGAGSSFAVGFDGTSAGAKTVSPATDVTMQVACVLGKPCVTPQRPWVTPPPTVLKK